jgi:hypothetical protein
MFDAVEGRRYSLGNGLAKSHASIEPFLDDVDES